MLVNVAFRPSVCVSSVKGNRLSFLPREISRRVPGGQGTIACRMRVGNGELGAMSGCVGTHTRPLLSSVPLPCETSCGGRLMDSVPCPTEAFQIPCRRIRSTPPRSFHDPAQGIHFLGAGNRFTQRWPSIYLSAVFHRLHAGPALSPTRPSIYLARVIQRPHARLPWAAVWPIRSLAWAGDIPGRRLA